MTMGTATKTANTTTGKRKVGRSRKTEQKHHVQVPAESALSRVLGVGRPGMCFGCGQPLVSHLGYKNAFVGCSNTLLPTNTVFALVPMVATKTGGMSLPNVPTVAPVTTARVAHTAHETSLVQRGPGRPPKAVVEAMAAPLKITRYTYEARDRRRKLVGATEAVVDAYNALVKAGKPLTAQDAAKRAKRPQEANRRCLNWLVEQGLVDKKPLMENAA